MSVMRWPGMSFPADHRPWPPPAHPWATAQRWEGLLFAHWPLPATQLRPAVPAVLPLDTYDGQAWLGIVPFSLTGLRFRGLPPVPGLSAFPEVNVRTYVTLGGKPGVYFLSLDAGNPFAVAGGRALHLPYFYAQMEVRRRGELVDYVSRRLAPPSPTGPPATLRARYWPVGPVTLPAPGSLAHWLTERYCLYAVAGGQRVRRLEIHHPPWLLSLAEARFAVNTMAAPAGLRLPDVPPLLHYARRQDAVTWPSEPLAGERAASPRLTLLTSP